MVDLVLRPSGWSKNDPKQWRLELLRDFGRDVTEHIGLCLLDDETARDVIRAGAAKWHLGEPDWDLHNRQVALAKAEAEVARLRAEIAARTGE